MANYHSVTSRLLWLVQFYANLMANLRRLNIFRVISTVQQTWNSSIWTAIDPIERVLTEGQWKITLLLLCFISFLQRWQMPIKESKEKKCQRKKKRKIKHWKKDPRITKWFIKRQHVYSDDTFNCFKVSFAGSSWFSHATKIVKTTK